MAKFSFTQNSLSSGEVSRSSWGASTQEHYANGAEKLKNMVLKDGVQRKRPGTIHVNALREPSSYSYPDANTTPVYSKYARLFPFSFQSAGASPRSPA